MKISSLASCTVLAGACLFAGCASKHDGRLVNTRQPGPAIGTGVGNVAGAVAGNVAGAVVGVGEGFAAAAAVPFDHNRRVVRSWRTETTADGRTIRVPVEIEVDQYGRPYTTAAASSAGASAPQGPR